MTQTGSLAPVIPLRASSVRAFMDAHELMMRQLAVVALSVPMPPRGKEAVWFVLRPTDFTRPPVPGRRVSIKRDLEVSVGLLILGMRTINLRVSVRRLSSRSKSYAVFLRAPA